MGEWPVGGTHNTDQISLPPYMGVVYGAPKQLQEQHQRSLIKDHHNKYNNNEKV